MAKFITFFGQKGGCGKTTLSILCANYLAYSQGKKVSVLDADYPQHSMINKRKLDYSKLPESVKEKRPLSHCFPIFPCCLGTPSINDKETKDVAPFILDERFRERLGDYVFVDFVGSMDFAENADIMHQCLAKMDYIFIPFEFSDLSLLSQYQSTLIMTKFIKKMNPSTKIITFFNKIPNQGNFFSGSKAEQKILEVYNKLNVDYKMGNGVSDSIRMRSFDCVNIVLPIKHKFLTGYENEGYRNEGRIGSFIDEFYSIITK